MSGACANSCGIRSRRLFGFHQRDEGDPRSPLGPCVLSASVPEFAYARGFYVWPPDSGVLPQVLSFVLQLCFVCNVGDPATGDHKGRLLGRIPTGAAWIGLDRVGARTRGGAIGGDWLLL